MSLTTLARVKTRLGLTNTDKDGAIDLLIPAVDRLIDRWCRPIILQTNRTEYPLVDSCNSRTLAPEVWPVASVASIHVSTALPRVYDATTLVSSDRYVIFGSEFRDIKRLDGVAWPNTDDHPNAVRLVYTGGFSSCPEDLEQIAVIPIIQAMLDKGIGHQYHLTGVMAPEGQLTGLRWEDIPTSAREVIEAYRNRRVA